MIAAESITREEARALLSALGALLAAYGFFYTGVKDRLAEAAMIDWTGFRSKRDLRPSLREATGARNLLVFLTACAGMVAALFAPVAVEILADLDPDSSYAPDKAALFLIEVFWMGLTAMMLRRAFKTASHVSTGRGKKGLLPET